MAVNMTGVEDTGLKFVMQKPDDDVSEETRAKILSQAMKPARPLAEGPQGLRQNFS